MAVQISKVFYPESFQDLFSAWSDFPNAVLYAGGSEFMRRQGRRVPVLPPNIISLDKIEELKRISRTERYLEIGAMARLNQIINLGKIVPEALLLCLESISGPPLRNFVTIGGNICNRELRLDLAAPMNVLDAQFELRTASAARWISASRFLSIQDGIIDLKGPKRKYHGPSGLGSHEILTRIRVPLEPWTYTWYHKFRNPGNDNTGGSILFMIRNQKNILTNIRVVYSGKTTLREKNCEAMFEGKQLPLSRNQVEVFMDKWRNFLSTFENNEDSVYPGENENFNPELTKTQILNFIETRLLHISS